MRDKRRCHRIHIELPVRVKIPGTQKYLAEASTLDVSAIGVCILSLEPFEVGQKLAMQVTLPTGQKIVINTQVVRIQAISTYHSADKIDRKYKIGVKILEDMSCDEIKYIKFFVEEMQAFFQKTNNPSSEEKDSPQASPGKKTKESS